MAIVNFKFNFREAVGKEQIKLKAIVVHLDHDCRIRHSNAGRDRACHQNNFQDLTGHRVLRTWHCSAKGKDVHASKKQLHLVALKKEEGLQTVQLDYYLDSF